MQLIWLSGNLGGNLLLLPTDQGLSNHFSQALVCSRVRSQSRGRSAGDFDMDCSEFNRDATGIATGILDGVVVGIVAKYFIAAMLLSLAKYLVLLFYSICK